MALKRRATVWLRICVLSCCIFGFIHETSYSSVLPNTPSYEVATFCGGCFWCMQPPYDPLKGVISTIVGYTGGHAKNPTYKQVSSGKTGHCEAVQVNFDPKVISYEKLLDIFWRNIDPTTKDRQFVDVGTQYRGAIFYHSSQQQQKALKSRKDLAASGRFSKPIVTEIEPFSVFYPAEEYHQKYYQKHPYRYKFYHHHSGRAQFLEKIWGKGRL